MNKLLDNTEVLETFNKFEKLPQFNNLKFSCLDIDKNQVKISYFIGDEHFSSIYNVFETILLFKMFKELYK